jgi:hypothetical protein
MPIGIDMNNYDISMGTGQIRMSGGGNMTMSSSSVTNQGIYYDISGWTTTTVPSNTWFGMTYGNGIYVTTAISTTQAGQFAHSTNGITWTAINGPTPVSAGTYSGRSVTYGPDSSGVNWFVATGQGNVAANAGAYSSTGSGTWTIMALPDSGIYRTVVNGKGRFVAISFTSATGGTRIIYSSYPSVPGSWSKATFDGSSNAWWGLAYGNDRFVAVGTTAGTSNQAAYSTDGINWTRSSSTVDSTWQSLTYGNGLFVAASAVEGLIMTSPDGITWTSRTSPTSFAITALSFANGIFIGIIRGATGNSNSIISQDGITWSLRATSIIDVSGFGIAFGTPSGTNGRFVANTPENSGTIPFNRFMYADSIVTNISSNLAKNNVFLGNDISMTDGLPAGYNWMTQNQNINGLRGICYGVPTTGPYAGKGLFVAVSENFSPYSNVRTSVDGINWVAQTTDASANQPWVSVCFGNGLFVAVSFNTATNNIMTSSDGVIWTVRTIPSLAVLQDVTFANNLFVAVANNGTRRVFISLNGINWNTIGSTVPDTLPSRSITYGNGRFVAVGDSGTYMYSTDASSNWITGTLTTNLWISIVYGNGLFVATSLTGTGNRVMTSPDGITWTIRTSAADNNWFGLTYGNGLFVATSITGTGNRIMISQDGINWTCRNVPNYQYATIAYGVVSSGIYAGQGIFVSPSFNSSNCIISVPGAQNNIAIGNNTTVDGLNSVAIGYGAKCTASNQVVIGSSGTSTFVLNSNGTVGIGTSNPQYTLDVAGSARIMENIQMGTGSTSYRRFTMGGGNSFGYLYGAFNQLGDGIHIGYNAYNDNASWKLHATGFGSGTSRISMGYGYIGLYTAPEGSDPPNNLGLYQNSSGKVGIGTTAPAATLDVNGTFGFAPNTITRLYSYPTPQYDANWNYYASSIGNTRWNGTSWTSNSDGIDYGCCAIVYGWRNIYFCANFKAGISSSTLTNAEMIASTRMTILPSGHVGIGTSSPTATLHVHRPGVNTVYTEQSILNVNGGDYSNGDESRTVYSAGITLKASDLIWFDGAIRVPGAKIYIGGGYSVNGQEGYNGPIEFSTAGGVRMRINEGGSVTIGGALSKGSGTFDIKHPIKEGYRLVHSFTESPRCDLIYRGKKQLINGQIIINIDKECVEDIDCAMTEGTFEALCANPTVYLQNNETFDKVIGKIVGNKLTILCENKTADCVIDWMVVAERKDELIKEWDKTNDNGYLKTEYKS